MVYEFVASILKKLQSKKFNQINRKLDENKLYYTSIYGKVNNKWHRDNKAT